MPSLSPSAPPSRRGDGFADMTYVRAAAREIASAISDFTVVITKSTVPVGEGDEVERIIARTNPAAEFAVVSNPEYSCARARPSATSSAPTASWSAPKTPGAEAVMREVYRPLYLNAAPILVTGRRTAD